MKEIGSEFWLEELEKKENHFFSRVEGEIQYLLSGRSALYYILQEIKTYSEPKTAYLPAYICASVIEPFLKMGINIIYYDVDARCNPLFDEKMTDKIDILLFCGYFGFITYQEAFLTQCMQKKICIIQDVTHTVFSAEGIYQKADYLLLSLRKWFGVFCGGMAVALKREFSRKPLAYDEQYVNWRKQGLTEKRTLYLSEDTALKKSWQEKFLLAENRLDLYTTGLQSDYESIRIIDFYPVLKMIERRRRNYLFLLEHLASDLIKPVFTTLPEGVCPLFFPVFSAKREQVKKNFIAQSIYPPIHWPVPEAIKLKKFPYAQGIYHTILSIPCDQRYTAKEMKRICQAVDNRGGFYMSWDKNWEEVFKNNEWGKYPGEDLIRFVARNFYGRSERNDVKILELGCGPGANLWYLAREGFCCYGIDGSKTAIDKAILRLKNDLGKDCSENILVGDIVDLPFEANYFDAVIDNEAVYCNDYEKSKKIYQEAYRVLKKSGKLFVRTFAEGSYGDVGKREYHSIAQGPLQGKGYTRFTSLNEIGDLLTGFHLHEIELLSRTYGGIQTGQAVKEWLIQAEK